ncbi:MAG: polyphosphate kinase 1 [Vicingaceae bacterium]|nr:polyphosphate kinase 1 [Vicingaceae bacterium]
MNKYFDRELSWLSFNYRVLQEAINPKVPLIERIRFLAIFSSNLDEFYRVRVASYMHLLKLQEIEGVPKDEKAKKLLKKIKKTVKKQQVEFGHIYRNELIPLLQKENIFIINDKDVTKEQQKFLAPYFNEKIKPFLQVTELDASATTFLKDKGLYLTVSSQNAHNTFYLINLPTDKTERFIKLPTNTNQEIIILLSDVIRVFINELIPNLKNPNCFAIKLSRDAELYLEEEIAETVKGKILNSLNKRKIGDPSRFLYDESMPKETLKVLRKYLGLKKDELVPGGRYHNFNDFFKLPIKGNPSLFYDDLPTLKHHELDNYPSIFEALQQKEFALHFPYQQYDYVLNFVEQASIDNAVLEINITLYRVAKESRICKALIVAAKNGKKVTVFSELKARFDEELNMKWASEMKAAGVSVIYSFEELKVHSKICLIKRQEGKKVVNYAYFGTGNFNEDTSKIYCDHALLTSDSQLTSELGNVFSFLKGEIKQPTFNHLLVAPFNLRQEFEHLIDAEIEHVKNGKIGKMVLKMNSLEDKQMIKKLYEASNAGVKIIIIVRGICCLIPGVDGMSKNIKVISIIDRYLEHGRIYLFHNNGDEKLYLASADWMKRNLSHRVEVAFPVYNTTLKNEIKKLISLQLKDNVKARNLNRTQSNPYKKSTSTTSVRAQYDFYDYLKPQFLS